MTTFTKQLPVINRRSIILIALTMFLISLLPAELRAATPSISLQRVATFSEPVAITGYPGSAKALVITERAGRVIRWRPGSGKSTLIDLRRKVTTAGQEQGLLSVAFDPKEKKPRSIYVNYTDLRGNTRVEQYRLGRKKPKLMRTLLTQYQPGDNHNGGQIKFGPDGFLYIGFGDGGGSGDSEGYAQNRKEWLGKMLRIDVHKRSAGKKYAIPPSNPYASGASGFRPEIIAYGLRNPWRFTFDRATGVMWIADVGQGDWEEIDRFDPATDLGANFGWNAREGAHPFDGGGAIQGEGATDPLSEYSHADGSCSITGGYVYRGKAIPDLVGWYVYADFCQSWVRAQMVSGESLGSVVEFTGVDQISTFGENAAGELYAARLGGELYSLRG